MHGAFLLIAAILAMLGLCPIKSIAVTPAEHSLRSHSILGTITFLGMNGLLCLSVLLLYDSYQALAGVRIVADNASSTGHWAFIRTLDIDPLVNLMWNQCTICRNTSSLDGEDQSNVRKVDDVLRDEMVSVLAGQELPGTFGSERTGSTIPRWFRDAVEPSLAVALSTREPVKQVIAASFGGEHSEAWKPAIAVLRTKGIQVQVRDLNFATSGGIKLEAIFGARLDSTINAWVLISGQGSQLQLAIFRASSATGLTLLNQCSVSVPSGDMGVRILGPALVNCPIPRDVGSNESLWIGDPSRTTITHIKISGSISQYKVQTDPIWANILNHFSADRSVGLAEDLADANSAVLRPELGVPDDKTLYLRYSNGIIGLASTPGALVGKLPVATATLNNLSDVVVSDNCSSLENALSWTGIYPRSTLSAWNADSTKVLTNSGGLVGGISKTAALYSLPDGSAEPTALVAAVRCLSVDAGVLEGENPPDSELVTINASVPPVLLWGEREADRARSRSDVIRLWFIIAIFLAMVLPAHIFARNSSWEKTK